MVSSFGTPAPCTRNSLREALGYASRQQIMTGRLKCKSRTWTVTYCVSGRIRRKACRMEISSMPLASAGRWGLQTRN